MMDTSKLDDDLLRALRGRGFSDDEIANLTPNMAFDEYCNWYGLNKWGPRLRHVMDYLALASRESAA